MSSLKAIQGLEEPKIEHELTDDQRKSSSSVDIDLEAVISSQIKSHNVHGDKRK